jgi:3D-(3,5/4)-trihydroxycyclohexane-1,2-dione acylhydrolase (decyclizing)
MMLNSELATSVMLGLKLVVVVLDNHGYGCINRLQMATGGECFNNLLADARQVRPAEIDFAAHMAAMGAGAEKVGSLAELQAAMTRARASERSYGIVIETDPLASTRAGGHWWDVAVPEVSDRPQVRTARESYENALVGQRRFD